MNQPDLTKPAKKYKILWVDDDPGVLATAERLFRYKPWQLITTDSPAEATEILRAEEIAVLISDQRMPRMTGVELLGFAEKESAVTTRILLTGFLESHVVEDAVNQARIFRFITKPWVDDELLLDVERAVEYFETNSSKKQLIREVTVQNRRLEELTSDLEKLVEERTFHIEDSKNQVERNLSKMRKLVLFIKELSGLRGLEDLMVLMRQEFKKFHQIGDPILAYMTHDERRKILHFVKREVVESKAVLPWPGGQRIRQNSKEDQKYLAAQFSRPFSKVIAIPIQRKGWGQKSAPSVLFIEHSLSAEQMEHFIAFISQRLQPISIAVDRIFLEYQAKFVSYQWETTFDGIESPIAIVDREYNLLRSNQKFAKSRRSRKCFHQFAADESTCLGCPVSVAIDQGRPHFGKVHVEGRIYNVYSYPIQLSEDERVTHVINYYSDITDARKLYSRVVQNEKLGAIGLLAGNIAHELNNPLTGIRSLAQVLLHEIPEKGNEQTVADLTEVEKAAQRSQIIIKNLLDFSKSDDSEALQLVPMNEVVEKTLPLLKTAMRNHSSEIELQEGSDFVRVKLPLLQQVFFNLVNNACQAMPGPGKVSIRTRTESKAGSAWAVLEVADTGPGIPEPVLNHIFEPFFTTKEEGKGTGLGLSMSQSIVEKFGGSIEVKSEVDKGTCFYVYLPVARP